jgi:hypothetical protein
MAGVAGGLQGHDAFAAIVSKFERPADIPGQIAARWGYYGQVGGKVPAGGSAIPGISGCKRNGPVGGITADQPGRPKHGRSVATPAVSGHGGRGTS